MHLNTCYHQGSSRDQYIVDVIVEDVVDSRRSDVFRPLLEGGQRWTFRHLVLFSVSFLGICFFSL